LTSDLERIAEDIRNSFSQKDAAREKALRLCREAIRHSANAIRAVHRGEYEPAQASLKTVRSLLDEMRQALGDYGELLYGRFAHDAEKEYAEASITLALITGNTLPSPDTLGVSHAAYLNGMGEAVGELRRHLLDSLRRGELPHCERLLAAMDDIYGVLVTIDFPDALTYGLKRTTDVVRGVLEKSRGDLTVALRQKELEGKLDSFADKLH
jgi:translin